MAIFKDEICERTMTIAVVLNFIEQQLLDDLEVELRKREESTTSEEMKLEMEKRRNDQRKRNKRRWINRFKADLDEYFDEKKNVA